MAGCKARIVISMEVFVEQQVILPVRICLELLRASVNHPPARLIPQEDSGQPIDNFAATWNRFIHLPELVGHSTLKLST